MTIDTTSFSEQVLDQASAWIVRLRSDQVTERDQEDFALWLGESAQHQLAFDEMMVLWEAMGSSSAKKQSSSVSALLGKVSADNGPRASNDCIADEASASEQLSPAACVSSINNPPSIQNSNATLTKQTKRKRRSLIAGLGSLAASVLIVGVVAFNQNLSSPPSISAPEKTLYATPVGKQQRFTLDDGSIIELNTDSKVSVQYTDKSRELHLLQGEAYFDVETNPSRPFTVRAGQGQVTALGTAFNIQLQDDQEFGGLFVAVTEGKVAVGKPGKDFNTNSIGVGIGYQTRVDNEGLVGDVEQADLEIVGAWREKTLIFRSTNLASALTELNRYLPNPVDTSDPSLKSLNISGTFSLDEPETTLSAIIDAFELQYYKSPFDNKTRLYRR